MKQPGSSRGRLTVTVAGRELSVSNLDKVLWPGDGYTKGDLIEYLVTVAPYLLPHLAGRPLNLTRYPDGIGGKSFYQKDIPDTAPPWVRTVTIVHGDHDVNYCLADSPATLAWLGQWGCLEIHPWLSRVDGLDNPDLVVFDLDPTPPAGFGEAVEIAFAVRRLLAEHGLRAYPKTSGATGVHLYLPIVRRFTYKEVARYVGRVADIIHQALPGRTTRERTVARRRGVYLDHLQNIKGKTLAAVYGPRPRPGAPVSTPVTWEELPGVRPEEWNLRTVPGRLARLGDIFAGALADVQDPGPMMAALGLTGGYEPTAPASEGGQGRWEPTDGLRNLNLKPVSSEARRGASSLPPGADRRAYGGKRPPGPGPEPPTAPRSSEPGGRG